MKILDGAGIHRLGDTALTITFGDEISPRISEHVVRAGAALAAASLPGVVETVPTFAALTVHFDPDIVRQDDLITALHRLGDLRDEAPPSGRIWRVPVLYDGPDLAETARAAGTSPAEIARLHAGKSYRVYMLGFLPGFAYLGDLPEAIRLPRLKEPRTRVPPGSVAIADRLTAVYPFESPGGWRLIGRTPLVLFDPRAQPPNLFAPGDTVTFHAVSQTEFEGPAHERTS